MEQVISLQRIEREAQEAARLYADINAACPYPFHSGAGQAFVRSFRDARERLLVLAEEDEPEDPHWCCCGNTPTIEESDWGTCDSCGKALP